GGNMIAHTPAICPAAIRAWLRNYDLHRPRTGQAPVFVTIAGAECGPSGAGRRGHRIGHCGDLVHLHYAHPGAGQEVGCAPWGLSTTTGERTAQWVAVGWMV